MAEENNGSWPNQQTPQSSEQPHNEQPNQTPQIVEGDQFTMTTGGEATNAEQPTETIPTAAPAAANPHRARRRQARHRPQPRPLSRRIAPHRNTAHTAPPPRSRPRNSIRSPRRPSRCRRRTTATRI